MQTHAFKRRFGSLFVTIGILLAASVGFYLGSNYVFRLEAIEVSEDGLAVSVDESKLPKNLLFFPADKLKQDILHDNPLLASIELKKKFPHTLVIIAKRRAPVARIQLESTIGLIDGLGYIVGFDDGQARPFIDLNPVQTVVGERVREDGVMAALALIEGVPQQYPIEKITRFDGLSIQANSGTLSIIIPQNIDAKTISSTLQTILDGFRIKGTMPTRIDLRFDKPVVQF